MVRLNQYISNLHLADKILMNPALDRGCIIECGTWRGGMAAGLATIGGPHRRYYFFDSFQGLPPVTHEDGEAARLWQADREGERYFNNCTASRGEFESVIACTNIPMEHLHIIEGYFAETFPRVNIPPIAILRLDADWYWSTLLCLEKFWKDLLPSALVLIDDYYDWEGCRKAVHRFLADREAPEAIQQSPLGKVAYIVKEEVRLQTFV